MQGPQPSAWHRERTPSTLALSLLSLNNAVTPQGITTPGPSMTVMVGHTASLWAPGFRTGLIQLNLILTQIPRPANSVPHQSCEVERKQDYVVGQESRGT